MNKKSNINPEVIERAERLKYLRRMTGMSMEKLANISNIGRTTINYWENALSETGISERGAKKLVELYNRLGLSCNYSWLMFGVGEPPAPEKQEYTKPHLFTQEIAKKVEKNIVNLHSSHNPDTIWYEEDLYKKEINLFLTGYEKYKPVVVTIDNDALQPIYEKDDIVGGIKLSENFDINNLKDTPLFCIIYPKIGGWIARQVVYDNEKKYYKTLQHNKKNTNYLNIENLDLHSQVYVIIRVWKNKITLYTQSQ